MARTTDSRLRGDQLEAVSGCRRGAPSARVHTAPGGRAAIGWARRMEKSVSRRWGLYLRQSRLQLGAPAQTTTLLPHDGRAKEGCELRRCCLHNIPHTARPAPTPTATPAPAHDTAIRGFLRIAHCCERALPPGARLTTALPPLTAPIDALPCPVPNEQAWRPRPRFQFIELDHAARCSPPFTAASCSLAAACCLSPLAAAPLSVATARM